MQLEIKGQLMRKFFSTNAFVRRNYVQLTAKCVFFESA